MIDIKKLIFIPFHDNFRIDKNFNIYIIDNEKIEFIPYLKMKFIYKDKTYYTLDLKNLVFYGIKNKYDFKNYTKLSENEIKINNINFKRIIDVPNNYFISSAGIIFSTTSKMILKQTIDRDGYHRISFPYKHLTNMAIHRLVYKIWKGKIPQGYVIHHMDNNKWNNDINNLQLTTAFLNSRYAVEDGLYNGTFHWTSEIVHNVCKLMENNICVKDIAAIYNIFPSDKKLYKNFRNQLYNFRNHQRSFIDITSQYNFIDYAGNIRPDSKYRIEEIRDMRRMYNDGISIDKIYEKYNKISRRYLVSILKGRKCKSMI